MLLYLPDPSYKTAIRSPVRIPPHSARFTCHSPRIHALNPSIVQIPQTNKVGPFYQNAAVDFIL